MIPAMAKRIFAKSDGKGFSAASIGGGLLNIGFGFSDYSDARAEGNGVLSSAALAAGGFALTNTIGFLPSMALTMAKPLAEGAISAFDAVNQYGRALDRKSRNVPFSNATFVDTQQTYTMRQAGMNLARQSKFAVQSAMLGDEARMINR